MYKYFVYIICFALLFSACNRHASSKNEEHQHATHEGHTHDHASQEEHEQEEPDHGSHEGHDHAKGDEHTHDKASTNEHSDEIIFTQAQAKAAGLQVLEVQAGIFHRVIKTNGQVQSAQGDEISLVATGNGIVSFAKSSIVEGTAVKTNEAVASVSSKNMMEGDATLKTKLAFDLAQREYTRAVALYKDTLISQKELDQIRLSYETAKVANDALSKSHTDKGISIRTPINGFIKSRLVNEGEYVSAGQVIVIVSQNKKLQLKADVSEKYYKSLPSITSANFKIPYDNTLYKLSELKGHLVSFGKTAVAESFYIPVTFEFDNTVQVIPGSHAEVYLLFTPLNNVISIPLSALLEEQGLYFVYTQLDEEGYKKQEVRIGDDNGQDVLILSGLQAGDRVVTKGAIQVKLAATSSIMPEGHNH